MPLAVWKAFGALYLVSPSTQFLKRILRKRCYGMDSKPVVAMSNRRYAAAGNRFRFYFGACRTRWRLHKVVPKLSWRGYGFAVNLAAKGRICCRNSRSLWPRH